MNRLVPPIALAIMLLALPALAAPRPTFNNAPWFGTLITSSSAGVDTFQVWLDEGPVDQTGRVYGWDDGQRAARNAAMNTAPKSWDEWSPHASWRYKFALMMKDQQYHPLPELNFLIININAFGPMPISGRPSWRATDADIVTVELADGRRLVSLPSMRIPMPSATVTEPGSEREAARMQIYCMLSGRTLYRADEFPLLWKGSSCHADKATANTFLVPVQNGGKPFHLKDITGLKVRILGTELMLQPRKRLTATTVGAN